MSTLHQYLPSDILPTELGGTGPAFNPGLWAEPVIHTAMKQAELQQPKCDSTVDESDFVDHHRKTDDEPVKTHHASTTGNSIVNKAINRESDSSKEQGKSIEGETLIDVPDDNNYHDELNMEKTILMSQLNDVTVK